METIKRKISLENSVDRTYNSPTWGTITATTFYLNININQNIDDMGMFTNIEYFPDNKVSSTNVDYSILINKLSASGITFPFMTGATSPTMTGITGTTKLVLRMPSSIESDYYVYGNSVITGFTDSKIEDVTSYNAINTYRIGFNTNTDVYENYLGNTINGVDRIKNTGEPTIYVFDTPNDNNLGTNNQKSGLQYLDYTGKTRVVLIDDVQTSIPETDFRFIGEGFNKTNTSLSALTKEEYLFGIISLPEVESDVFIDRGLTSVMDMHLRLSEVKNLDELSKYGNGFYNLNKQ